MTSGTIVSDGTSAVSTDFGPGRIGSYVSRTWNGADQWAASAPRDPSLFGAPDKMLDALYRAPDKGLSEARIEARNRIRRSLSTRRRPPKRVRFDEHGYSASGVSYTDSRVVWGPYPNEWNQSVYDTYYTGTVMNNGGRPSVVSGDRYSWDNNRDIQLVSKLRTKILGSDFDLGVFLGEGHEALSMIASSATTIYEAYHAVKRGNLWGAVGAFARQGSRSPRIDLHRWMAKNASGRWLELQYGWLPLVSDCYAAAEFLAQMLNFPISKEYVVRARTRAVKVRAASPYLSYESSQGIFRKQIKAKISHINLATLTGLANPATVAWELMPFSFVADWFIPIGDYLRAAGTQGSLTGTFVTSEYSSAIVKGPVTGNFPGMRPISVAGSEVFRYSDWSVLRTVSDILNVPQPRVKPLSKVLTWKHAANAVALVVQNFASIHSPKSEKTE